MLAIELQRLVDGELSHGQRVELLRSLGDDAQQWRKLALALLEEQQWSRSIHPELLEQPKMEQSLGGEQTGTDLCLKTFSDPASVGSKPHGLSPLMDVRVVPPSGRMGSWNWMTALAASALLTAGLSGGVLIRSLQHSASQLPVADASPASPMRQQVVSAAPSPRASESMRMVFGGEDAPASEIPLLDAREVDPNLVFANDAYELARLKQQLHRQGHRLEVEPKLYTGRLNDGRQVVVPVHNVALKSVGL
jgi:hypothetical protein